LVPVQADVTGLLIAGKNVVAVKAINGGDAPNSAGVIGEIVVFGAEGHGLRRRVAECCDALIALPLRGEIGSLNVNAAAGAILYEVLRRRGGP